MTESEMRLIHEAASFAISIEKFTSAAELLEQLHQIVVPFGLRVYGLWRITSSDPLRYDHQRREGITQYRHSSAPEGLSAEYRALAEKNGTSALARMALQNRGPFTFTECARASKAAKGDQWVFELNRRYGVRDGLCVPVAVMPRMGQWSPGLWVIRFWSPHVVKLSPAVRATIHFAGAQVAYRMEQVIKPRSRKDAKPPALSMRQWEVLTELAHGKTTQQIAQRIGISESSVKNFVQRAKNKLNAETREHLIYLVVRALLVQ